MIWIPAKLGQLLTLEYGKALPRSERVETGAVPVAGSNGCDGNHDTALVEGPGVVVGRKGSAGKVTWFDTGFWPIDTTYFVRHEPKVASLRWLYYLLRFKKLERLSKTTGVPGLNRNDAYAEACMLPAPKEQHRIVQLLDEADRLRQLRGQADARAARILPALFLDMFGHPSANPRGFERKPLGELIRVKSGNFLPTKDMAVDGQFPVYGGNGVSGHHDSYMFDDRKVVIGRVGAYCGVVHYSQPKAWITDNALYVSEKLSPLDDRYLIAALEQADLNQYAGRAGQPLISGSRIYPIEVLDPPPELQRRFALSVEEVDEISGRTATASKSLDCLWEVLMRHAFTGHLTAKWREPRMKELLAEMEAQARLLNVPLTIEASA